MTPAKRRKITRTVLFILIAFVLGLSGRVLFTDTQIPLSQKLAYYLLGRRPGASAPGTELVKKLQGDNTSASHEPEDQNPIKLDFNTLGGWEYIENKTPIPDNVQALNDKWAYASGFMLPISETKDITRFILVQNLWGCCFGKTPAVNHIILIQMEPGKAVDYYQDPIKVTGKFYVKETREEGYLVGLYTMTATSVMVR